MTIYSEEILLHFHFTWNRLNNEEMDNAFFKCGFEENGAAIRQVRESTKHIFIANIYKTLNYKSITEKFSPWWLIVNKLEFI